MSTVLCLLAAVTVPSSGVAMTKRGLSGLVGCNDARALGLDKSWWYNWGLNTNVGGMAGGNEPCSPHRASEFVPMFWGCSGNCTAGITADVRAGLAAAGVAYVLGFNEPDNPGQSNLTPGASCAVLVPAGRLGHSAPAEGS